MKKLFKIILIILFLPISLPILVVKSKLWKPLKIIILVLYIGIIIFALLSPSKYTPEERAATKTAAILLTPTKTNIPESTNTKEPTKTVVPIDTPSPTEILVHDEIEAESHKTTDTILEFIMIDGETLGEYGKYVTLNANTDMSYTYIGYFVPSGFYKVENYKEPWDQFNLYSAETKIQDGWEESAEGNAWLIKPGESLEVEIPEGFYVKVSPKARINMYRIDRTEQ